jgi:hypothetical protein
VWGWCGGQGKEGCNDIQCEAEKLDVQGRCMYMGRAPVAAMFGSMAMEAAM